MSRVSFWDRYTLTKLRPEVVMKRAQRFAEYEGWKIEASPIILSGQRLFQAGVVIESTDGERFVFSDLGNRVYRWQA
uniref:Uncharacterized protein n=1 Tax=Burkholderia pseudomallei TaxID=28450 RepID=A0A0C5B275_BURPE|nr:hypothetical protein pBPS012 [Burkholderia pseudomallei]